MLHGGTAWFSALALVALALPVGLAGWVVVPEDGPGMGEAVEPHFSPVPTVEDEEITLERFEVEPRTEPVVPGTSVAIRAVVDTGELRAPVHLQVDILHSEGATYLSPAPGIPGSDGSVFLATYWDAEGVGPFEVTGSVSVAGQEVPLPKESGSVEAQEHDGGSEGWMRMIVEGTLLWTVVLAGLVFASRWARGYDGPDEGDP